MPKIRVRKETGNLYLDFQYRGTRCREQTMLPDTPSNHQRLEKLLAKIQQQIIRDQFNYADYFPNSARVKLFNTSPSQGNLATVNESTVPKQDITQEPTPLTPLFSIFAEEWYVEKKISWKRSYQDKIYEILNLHIYPVFGKYNVCQIKKPDILKFRVALNKPRSKNKKPLSNDRINQVINLLKQITDEAADRFDFTAPYRGIKPLRIPRTIIEPFSIEEVRKILSNTSNKWKNYYTIRFFTGMRTSEIDGLKWKYVDFERKQIHVHETLVKGEVDTVKTDGSDRYIDMSTLVYEAFSHQRLKSDEKNEFVFSNKYGGPYLYRNISNRVWYPLLKKLNIKFRRPYQTRHTAATLWLAAGESPEWIAKQMGHSTTKMLFTIYSRYVPNLTRRDGSAFENLLNTRFDISPQENTDESN